MSGTEILINLLGGVALLLWGLRTVQMGMTRAFGSFMRPLVGRTLANPFNGFWAGLGITLLLQSSTATALLVSSFVVRGATVHGSGSIAALLGADLGTALVTNVLALGTSYLAPVLLVVGFLLSRLARLKQVQEIGRALVGIGLILLSLQLIVAASLPMRESPAMTAVFSALDDDLPLAFLLGFCLAWLAHSSMAIVLLMSTLVGGPVGLETALALVLGANVGNTLPPVFATWGSSPSALRIPLSNVAMRLTGVLLALPLLGMAAAQLPNLHDDQMLQVVHFHLLFNLALAVLFLPMAGVVSRLMTRLVPEKEKREKKDDMAPRHLDEAALASPTVALAYAVRDATKMGEIAERMLAELETAIKQYDANLARAARGLDDVLDRFYAELMAYLSQLHNQDLSEEDSRRFTEIMSLTINLEHIGDLLDANIGERIERLIKARIHFEPEVREQLLDMFERTRECMSLSFAVFLTNDLDLAHKLLQMKIRLGKHERKLTLGQQSGIQTHGNAEAWSAFIDLLGDLKRVCSYSSSVAYPIVDRAGLLRGSRLISKDADSESDR